MKALFRWAYNALYSSGPKALSPTRVNPAAMSADGVQPGNGTKLGAEGLNYLLARLIENSSFAILSKFEDSRTLTRPSNVNLTPAGTKITAGRNPLTGSFFTSGVNTSSENLVLLQLIQNAWSTVAELNFISAGYASATFEPLRGSVPGLAWVHSVSSADLSTHVGVIGALDSVLYLTPYDPGLGNSALSHAAAYDAVNGALVIVRVDDDAPPYMLGLRVVDGSGAVTASTTQPPGPAPSSTNLSCGIAAGVGVVVYGYSTDTDSSVVFQRTTDGGANWSTSATLSGAVSSLKMLDLEYFEEYRGKGSGFVALLLRDAAGGPEYVTFFSTDGQAWEELNAYDADSFSAHALLFDELIIASREPFAPTIRVINPENGNEFAAPMPITTGTFDIFRDREMIRVGGEKFSSNEAAITPAISPGLPFDGSPWA